MTIVNIDIRDIAKTTHPDDRVIFRSPVHRQSPQGGIVSTADHTVELVGGIGQVDLTPGEVTVILQCRGISDTRPKAGAVPSVGPVSLMTVLSNTIDDPRHPAETNQEEYAIVETSSVETYLEVSALFPASQNPPGPKPMVLAEVNGESGVLTEIWCALQSDLNGVRNSPLEDGTMIRIYIDDRMTPTVSMPVADFFGYSGGAGKFDNPKIARVDASGFRSGAYRNLWAPFRGYMRVEFENTTETELLAYGSVSYRTGTTFPHQRFKIASTNTKTAKPYSEVVVADIKGSGQLESVMLAMSSSKNWDYGPLEGNYRVEIDGKRVSVSSGTEDFFRGAWYTLPVGGYPIGRAGDSTFPGSHISLYRFFPHTAFRFHKSLKVVFPVGQVGQGEMLDTKYQIAGSASYWELDSAISPNAKVPDYDHPAEEYDFSGGTGGAAFSRWKTDPGKRAPTFNAQGVHMHTGTEAETDVADQRMWLVDIVVPDEFWLETEMIWETAPVGSDAGLLFLGGTVAWPDPMFGTACHMTMDAIDNQGFRLRPRDVWDGPFVTTYPHGNPIGTKIGLAVRKMDGKITTYYRPPNQDFWTAINSWTPTTSGPTVGLYSWRAGVTFTKFGLYPLKSA